VTTFAKESENCLFVEDAAGRPISQLNPNGSGHRNCDVIFESEEQFLAPRAALGTLRFLLFYELLSHFLSADLEF
jgi:hypothetical protein